MTHINFTLLTIALVVIVVIIVVKIKGIPSRGSQEDLSYSFGFPTHGSYNYGGGPLRGGWPGGSWWPRQYRRPYGPGSYGWNPYSYGGYVY